MKFRESPKEPDLTELSEYLKVATEIARKAGDVLLRHYANIQVVEWKDHHHVKTKADDESDALIRREITERFPNHNIFSEELPDKDLGSEISWVEDPLDGTIPYSSGISDHWGVSIGVVIGRRPVVGVVHLPKRGQLFQAQEGMGAFMNGEKIRVSNVDDLQKALIGVEYGTTNRTAALPAMRRFLSLEGVTYPVTYGSAASALSLVAEGKLHGYYSAGLEPWDMVAAVILIREAGGKVTDAKGKEWELGDTSIIAANEKLHHQLMALLAGHGEDKH